MINNIVIVSGTQQSDSAVHIHVSIPPQPPSHPSCHLTPEFLVPHSRSLSVIHFKYSRVYLSIPNSLIIPSFNPSPPVTIMNSILTKPGIRWCQAWENRVVGIEWTEGREVENEVGRMVRGQSLQNFEDHDGYKWIVKPLEGLIWGMAWSDTLKFLYLSWPG